MATELRPTGIAAVGARPWGSHICLFYETKADLLDLLIPFFSAGLENHEVCLYVASEPLLEEEALQALSRAIPRFERYRADGQAEVTSYLHWYLADGSFDPTRVQQGWIERLNLGLAHGYAGLRFLANLSWLPRQDWDRFAAYEESLDATLSGQRMLALCAYALDRCQARDVLDVVHHHQFTLARRDGQWETLNGSELRRALDAIQKLSADLEQQVIARTAELAGANERLKQEVAERQRAEVAAREGQRRWQALFDGSLDAMVLLDDRWDIVDANPAASALLGYSQAELLSMSSSALALPPTPDELQALGQEVQAAGRLRGEHTIVRQDGTQRQVAYHLIHNFRPGLHIVVFDDITERKRAEEALRVQSARTYLLWEVSQAFAEAGLDYDAVLQTIARRISERIGVYSGILLFSDDGQKVYTVAFHHPDPRAMALMQDALQGWEGDTNSERFRRLLAGETLYLPIVDPKEFRASFEPEFWTYIDQVGVASVLAVPLQIHGSVIGALTLMRDQPGRPYTPDDRLLTQSLAHLAALTIQNARLFASVSEQRERLRRLSARLLEAQEAERRLIARELHDVIGQTFTAVKINLQALQHSLSEPQNAGVDESIGMVEAALQQVRDQSMELRPSVLDDLGLAAALRWYADRLAQRAGLEARVRAALPEQRLPADVETVCFRVAQEALINVVRHARAKRVDVNLSLHGNYLELVVSDDGVGFDAQAAQTGSEASQHLGLLGMQERVALVGGVLVISSTSGHGSRVSARFAVTGKPQPGDARSGSLET